MSNMYKVTVDAEESNAEAVILAIGNAGGGKLGNYTHCSFTVKGTGHFLPEQGAHPTVGKVGQLASVTEERIEVTCTKESLKEIVAAIKRAHSYEEPVIDIYLLLDPESI